MSLTKGITIRKNKEGIEWNIDAVRETLTLTPLVSRNIVKNLPIAGACYYADDFWDFNVFNKLNKPKGDYQLSFSGIEDSYKPYTKELALRQLSLKRVRIVTIKTKIGIIREFLNWLDEQKILYVETIYTSLLSKYFDNMNITEHLLNYKKFVIKEFIQVIEKHLKCDFNSIYELLSKTDKIKEKQQKENNKHKIIPYQSTKDSISCFDKIVSLAINDLANENLSVKVKMTACMIVIMAETGMRIGEFRILEVNKLKPIKHPIKNHKGSEHILEFITYKTTVEQDGKLTQTFMTPNAVLAYNTLVSITESRRKKSNTPQYLFLNLRSSLYSDVSTLWNLNRDFYYRHQNELGFDLMAQDELSQFHVWNPTENDIISHDAKPEDFGEIFYYVTPHQYRVTCATILYVRERKSLEWIRRHMNHLSTEMTEHYIREEAKKKQQIGIAKALITRSNIDGTQLETDINNVVYSEIKNELKDEKFKKAYDEINKFLNKLSKGRKKLNIKKDINEIIESLYKTKISITELELGFCALDTLEMLCERQTQLNRLEDIDIQIPTIETLYISYKRFKDKIQVINYNYKLFKENDSYKSSYEREINNFSMFLKKRFLPELELLENEIKILGHKVIIERYVSIQPLVDDLDNIKKEVLEWRQKIVI